MKRDELGDLIAFLAVCEERSFTKAAARLGTSQSSLSHTVKRLEERLDLRLLTRTTRNVSPTEVGEKLAATLRPSLDNIENELRGLSVFRSRPAGLVRINSSRKAAMDILYPKLAPIMKEYPDIRIEISIDAKWTDIVEQRFDAGVRLGESVEKDMIAVRIGPNCACWWLARLTISQNTGTRKHPMILRNIHASICACRRWAGFTPGIRERRQAAQCARRGAIHVR